MFSIILDSTSHIPMYQQIYEYIKIEIRNGSISYKSKLPSSRELSTFLNVSRNTVDTAYQQLVSEGYINSYPKKGYYVNEISLLADFTNIQESKNTIFPKKDNFHLYDFSPFSVDLNHFPYSVWRQLSKNCLQDYSDLFLLGENAGDEPFRKAITTYLHSSRNVNCSKDQIIIGAGVDYLLHLLSRILGNPQNIAMENPSYIRAYHILKENGHTLYPIPLDTYGMNMDALYKSFANIAYVTPSHQYPLGIVMPVRRRNELLIWADETNDRYIIEDDHDSEFRYKGKPIPSLQGFDTNQKVIYIGTFSRAIAPAIRVGYMVLPQDLLKRYHEISSHYTCTVSRIDQVILTDFLAKGYFEKHLNRMRKIYKEKHDTIIHCLKPLSRYIEIGGDNAGLHLVIQIRKEILRNIYDSGKSHFYQSTLLERQVLEHASKAGIRLYGLSEHFIAEPAKYYPTFLLGFANIQECEIKEGIDLLVKEFGKLL